LIPAAGAQKGDVHFPRQPDALIAPSAKKYGVPGAAKQSLILHDGIFDRFPAQIPVPSHSGLTFKERKSAACLKPSQWRYGKAFRD